MLQKPVDSVLASEAEGILAADLSAASTSFTLQAGQGAAFPESDFSVEINGETIDVGTRSTDTFSSLTRANPVPHTGGARGEHVYHVTSGAAIADAVAAGPGGSQPVEVISVPIAFDTPGLTTGLDLGYTPAVGDVIELFVVSVTTAFDGTNPLVALYLAGFDPFDHNFGNANVAFADGAGSTGVSDAAGTSTGVPHPFNTSAAIKAKLIDSVTGEDPGSTMGEGRLTLVIVKAQ